MNLYTMTKDFFRNLGKPHASPEECKDYIHGIAEKLKAMEVSPKLYAKIMTNVATTYVRSDFERADSILAILSERNIKGYAADEFLKGAHFIYDDGGKLFNQLKQVEGSALRYSSHFADTRILELGISCGRILPEVLFILSEPEKGTLLSHFQAEGSPWRGWKMDKEFLQTSEHIRHSLTYFTKKIVSQSKSRQVKNLGPYGWSNHDDSNPIRNGTLTSQEIEGLRTATSSQKSADDEASSSNATSAATEIEESNASIFLNAAERFFRMVDMLMLNQFQTKERITLLQAEAKQLLWRSNEINKISGNDLTAAALLAKTCKNQTDILVNYQATLHTMGLLKELNNLIVPAIKMTHHMQTLESLPRDATLSPEQQKMREDIAALQTCITIQTQRKDFELSYTPEKYQQLSREIEILAGRGQSLDKSRLSKKKKVHDLAKKMDQNFNSGSPEISYYMCLLNTILLLSDTSQKSHGFLWGMVNKESSLRKKLTTILTKTLDKNIHDSVCRYDNFLEKTPHDPSLNAQQTYQWLVMITCAIYEKTKTLAKNLNNSPAIKLTETFLEDLQKNQHQYTEFVNDVTKGIKVLENRDSPATTPESSLSHRSKNASV